MKKILLCFCVFSFSIFAAPADSGQDAVSSALTTGKGLVVRVPVTDNGEDTSLAEYRVSGGVGAREELPTAWSHGTDISGFAEIAKPTESSGSGVSTCYYCGYYTPRLWYSNYYYYYYRPVYTYRVVYYYVTYVYYYYPTWYSYYGPYYGW